MLILRIATRNLFRQLSRNLLSMVSIIMGVSVIVLGRGFQNGLNENMVRGAIDSAVGHAIVEPIDYPENGMRHPVDDAFALTSEQVGWLDDHTTAWTPRILATPRLIKGRDNMRVRLTGVASTDESVFPRDSWTLDGAVPKAGELLLGSTPARLMRAEVGDIVTLETRTVDGALNAMRYPVSGIVKSGNPLIDNVGVFADLATADALINAQGRITHVGTRIANRDLAPALVSELNAAIPQGRARSWEDEVAPMIEASAVRQTMFDVIGLALLAMAATGIANTVLMAAYERTREIGTLRTMGLKRSGVLAMFAIEGFWMGVVGGFIGVVLSGAVCWYYSQHGIELASLMAGKEKQMSSVPISAMLYLEYSTRTLGLAWLVGIVVAVVASVYPAFSASKISPAEAVRAS